MQEGFETIYSHMNQRTDIEPHFNSLFRYITEKSGIALDGRRKQHLSEFVAERCRILGVSNVSAYSSLLKASPEHKEFSRLMDFLTIQESSFFRHKAQFDALQGLCLHALSGERGEDRHIHIWSAGCANGEEAYSIAMLVRELAPQRPEDHFFIKGTDISRQALQKAREGVYSERAIRSLEPRYLNRYFSKEGGRYHLNHEIKGMVDFAYFNLAEDPFPNEIMSGWDFILCRNVIIYFSLEHQRTLLKNFYSVLSEGGYLFAGYSETMRYLNDDFIPVQMKGAFVYLKPLPGQSPQQEDLSASETSERRPFPGKLEMRSGAGNRRGGRPTSSVAHHGPMPVRTIGKDSERHVPSKQELAHLLAAGESATEASASLDESLSLAAQLTDRGQTVDAVALLDDILHKNPLCARAYFLLAMIYGDSGSLDPAIRYLKKVLYLEPGNARARFYLADLFKEASQKSQAAREYVNVITLLENREYLEKETYDDGFTDEALLAAAQAHLKSLNRTDSIGV